MMLCREEIEQLDGPWLADAVRGKCLMFENSCHPGAGLTAYYLWPRGTVKLRCYVCKHEVAEIRVAPLWTPGTAPTPRAAALVEAMREREA